MNANILTQSIPKLPTATQSFLYSCAKKSNPEQTNIYDLPRDSCGKIPYYDQKKGMKLFLTCYCLQDNPYKSQVGHILFQLLDRWNEMGREDVFEYDMESLEFITDYSKNTINRVRKILVALGVCAYVPGNRGHHAFYQLNDFRVFANIGFDKMQPFEIDEKELKKAMKRAEKTTVTSCSEKASNMIVRFIERITGASNDYNNMSEEDIQEAVSQKIAKHKASETVNSIKDSSRITRKFRDFLTKNKAEEDTSSPEVHQHAQKNDALTGSSNFEMQPSQGRQINSSYIERYTENFTESICPNFKKSEQIQEEDEASTDATLNTLSQDIFSSLQDQWSAAFQGAHIHSSRRRMKKLQNLLKEFGADQVREAIHKVFASSFLMGNIPLREREGGFKLKVDFILDRSNFVKILEGLYDDETYGTRTACENINKSNLVYEGYSKKESARDQQYTKNQQDDYDWFYGLGEFADTEEETCAYCENNNDEVLKAVPAIKSTEPMPANQAEPTTQSAEDTSDEDWFYSVGWALA